MKITKNDDIFYMTLNKISYGFNGLSPSLALKALAAAISASFGSTSSFGFLDFFSFFDFSFLGDFERFRSLRSLSECLSLERDLDRRDLL